MSVTTFRIETRTVVRLLTTILVFGFITLMLFKLSALLVIFIIAFFLAIALNPPVTRLARVLPHRSRVGATALAYLVVLAVLGVLAYVAAPPVVQQTGSFVNNFPEYIRSFTDNQSSIGSLIERYQLQDEMDRFLETAKNESGTIAQGVGSSFVSGVNSVLNGTITVFTILVLTFLMLIEGPSWIQRLWSLYSNKRRLARDQRILEKMYHVVTGYVNGQVVVAAIGATSVFVVLFVLSRIFSEVPPGAILPLTGIAFVAGLIPMVGAVIAATIIAIVLLFNSIPAALVFIVYYLIYQQIENNVIQPVVQSRTVQLSALAVISAAILGIGVLGIVGAIIAIPIAGCIRVLVLDYLSHRNDYVSHSQETIAAGKRSTK